MKPLPSICLSILRKLYAWYSILTRIMYTIMLPQHFLDWPWLGVSYHMLTNLNILDTLLKKIFQIILISIEKLNACTLTPILWWDDFIGVLSGWNYNYSEHTACVFMMLPCGLTLMYKQWNILNLAILNALKCFWLPKIPQCDSNVAWITITYFRNRAV